MEPSMKGTLIAMTAVLGLTLAAPAAFAEDVYVGGRAGGVGVGVDVGEGYHRDRDRERVYTDSYERSRERCRTTIIREGGTVRKIRRCRD
jgi:hypothetical protein